jgi:acyl-CoA synthetase (NDP forming)
MVCHKIDVAFHPKSVAVVGASENVYSLGYSYVEHLKTYGFKGIVYPVTPKYTEILGFKTYPDLDNIPGPVDFVICCLPAEKVPGLIKQCSAKGVKVVHLFTGRFGETGEHASARLESEIYHLAKQADVRIIGPNCMGIYHPRAGLSFGYDFPTEPGKLGLVFQSGGACAEFIYYAALRGIRFSKAVSYGNAIDIDESDMIEYLAEDKETKIIACYIEGVKNGKKFIHTLKRVAKRKPVIVLKAGRSSSGARSAASHTASMAGSFEIWKSVVKQTGIVPARSLSDMIDLAVGFYFLPPIRGYRVGVVGGGGGQSVLSADDWEESGFSLPPFTPEIRETVKQMVPELWWKWLSNPVDVSVFPPAAFAGNLNEKIMGIMAESEGFDLVVANFTIGAPRSKAQMSERLNDYTSHIIASKGHANPIVAVLNTGVLSPNHFDDERYKSLSEIKERLVIEGIPLFDSSGRAAAAVSRILKYYNRHSGESGDG